MAGPSKKYLKKKPIETSKLNKTSKKSFKTKKEPKEAVQLQLEDDVPDFPRGSILFSLIYFLFYCACSICSRRNSSNGIAD